MKKVYIVTSGCFSDYHIDRIFTSEIEANKYIKWIEKNDCYENARIEKYSLLDSFKQCNTDVYDDFIMLNFDFNSLEYLGFAYTNKHFPKPVFKSFTEKRIITVCLRNTEEFEDEGEKQKQIDLSQLKAVQIKEEFIIKNHHLLKDENTGD